MGEDLGALLSSVSVLREVDATVDFARGWLQLRILLVVGSLGRCTVDRLVEIVGERRKAVLDALRKMRTKGLIEGGDTLSLSEDGLRIYRTLVSVLSGAFVTSAASRYVRAMTTDLHRDIAKFSYLYDVIVALGTSKGFELPLDTLASITRLSPETLEDYLKPFVEDEPKLFKRVVKRGKLLSRRKVYYRLTEDGLKVYHRLPEYVKYRGSVAAALLRSLTNSGHPRVVLKRVAITLALGSAATSALAALLTPPISAIAALSWILIVSLLAVLVELTY